MKRIVLFCFYFLASTFAYQTLAQSDSKRCLEKFSPNGDLLHYSNLVDLNKYKGMTFLSLMRQVVKPAIDVIANEGYSVADAKTVDAALTSSVIGSKVCRLTLREASVEEIKQIAQSLHDSKVKVNYKTIDDAIARNGGTANQRKLAYFYGLVSGGGVGVKIDPTNYYYNIHYGDGKTDEDERTGRSYGSTPEHGADDISDAVYLKTLQNFVTTRPEGEILDFYRILLHILMNLDTAGYGKLPAIAQTVGTDFLAVYTAEQDRHLMSNFEKHPWDIALFQVTLLAAFHAGQEKIKVMFQGKLTDTTLEQAPGGSLREKTQAASLVDYWQFSTNPNPEGRGRSGINITKREFESLGKLITEYEQKYHPEIILEAEKLMGIKGSTNLFKSFSHYLINLDAPKTIPHYRTLAESFVAFLAQVKKDANLITKFIEDKQQE